MPQEVGAPLLFIRFTTRKQFEQVAGNVSLVVRFYDDEENDSLGSTTERMHFLVRVGSHERSFCDVLEKTEDWSKVKQLLSLPISELVNDNGDFATVQLKLL